MSILGQNRTHEIEKNYIYVREAVPACDIRDQFELTGGSSGHVSVDLAQKGGREME